MKPPALATLLCVLLASCVHEEPRAATAPSLTFLRTDGTRIVNERGEVVALRGYNLGSWLLLEPWMVKLNDQPGIQAEKDIWDLLEQRFGADRMRACVAAHRENFVTEADIDRLHQLGVTFVRVPIWWRVLGDTTYDTNGWRYVDNLLDWCEKRGVYVLLDLHGAPGGQNTGANILGERPDGTYWATNSPHRAETVAWWRNVAKRYRDRSVVAGYDLLNEAWAAPSVKVLVAHMDEIYRAIREVDPRHMIYIEDALQGYHRLPIPADVGWTNVVYSFHFYPEDGMRFAGRDTVGVRAAQLQYDVPVHIGEFNLYSASRGGVSALDASLAVFNASGWSWNIWSFKLLEDNRDYFWGLTGYTDRTLPGVSLKESSYDDILSYFRHGASSNWREHNLVRAALEHQLHAPAARDDDASSALHATLLAHDAKDGLRVEWQRTPPNLGFWKPPDSAAWKIAAPRDGAYQLDLVYSTGTNNVTVTVYADGVAMPAVSMQSTGDWTQYRPGSVPCGTLRTGPHVLRLTCSGGDTLLNLREAKLVANDNGRPASSASEIELTPAEVGRFERKGHICVEWQNSPPNIGYWNDGDAVAFRFHLAAAATFAPSFWWSSPNEIVRIRVEINGSDGGTFGLAGTGDWHRYEWQTGVQRIHLPAGEVELKLTTVEVTNESGAGNLRAIKLEAE